LNSEWLLTREESGRTQFSVENGKNTTSKIAGMMLLMTQEMELQKITTITLERLLQDQKKLVYQRHYQKTMTIRIKHGRKK
jgi:hypothetical protein